jgi:hypothetical protein
VGRERRAADDDPDHVLLAVEAIARRTDPAAIQLGSPPSDAEKHLGSVFGEAFHQGCSLADVART